VLERLCQRRSPLSIDRRGLSGRDHRITPAETIGSAHRSRDRRLHAPRTPDPREIAAGRACRLGVAVPMMEIREMSV
jgi:hypothetical protein